LSFREQEKRRKMANKDSKIWGHTIWMKIHFLIAASLSLCPFLPASVFFPLSYLKI
jgi:hypothetical protein